MVPNHATASTTAGDGDGEVMASVDDAGPIERLVLADISRDGAWLSVAVGDAAVLAEQR